MFNFLIYIGELVIVHMLFKLKDVVEAPGSRTERSVEEKQGDGKVSFETEKLSKEDVKNMKQV